MAGELIHTEEEASKILCPQFKTGCRGSGCMWWRWAREQENSFLDTPNGEDWTRAESVRGTRYWYRWAFHRGYCGIAGRPEGA